ncbi:uncharacterized protein LOC134536304 [Bacillus rossius redtenbacheri]|uniref:uncharacterized protein LOC134536304 n=1 Tax=Bacillus rossius redtenbacheri TaxID=93214 RepID=UPI002FDD46CC
MAARAGSDPPPPAASELPALWDLDSADYECDCPGPPPPPHFGLPPPPRPPFLQELDCSDVPLPDLETCDAVPVIDAEYHSSPAIPSIAVIVVCSVLLLVMVLIASVLVWKHKRKMQNFLPCKTSPQNRCDVSSGNGVIYEDLTNIRPRAMANHCAPGQTAPSIEMIDVKSCPNYSSGFSVINHPSVFICPPTRPDAYTSQDLYNPVYEELSNGSGERGDSEPDSEEPAPGAASEDDFAEDELSLGGGDRERRRRGAFHEGLLLDALLQLYPNVVTLGGGAGGRAPRDRPPPAPRGRLANPYESVPVLGPLQQHGYLACRPGKAPSQDSDSGYSNHTSGGRTASSRSRKVAHRLPARSGDTALS